MLYPSFVISTSEMKVTVGEQCCIKQYFVFSKFVISQFHCTLTKLTRICLIKTTLGQTLDAYFIYHRKPFNSLSTQFKCLATCTYNHSHVQLYLNQSIILKVFRVICTKLLYMYYIQCLTGS